MTEANVPGSDAIAERLIGELKRVLEEAANAGEDERRAAFDGVLDAQLSGLPAEAAEPILATVKTRLVDEFRQGHARIGELEQRRRTLEEQLTASNAERDRLREENRSLSRQPAAAQPAAARGEADLGAFREALLRVSAGQNVDPADAGIPPAEVGLFQLFRTLLDFALRYELALNLLLAEFKIGPAGDADTKLAQGMREQVRERFRGCLQDREGAIRELKEALDRNAGFLVDLNRAYQSSIFDGNRSLLSQLDPRPILEQHKRVLGTDFEGAWKTISRQQGDLSSLARGELWERFFVGPFREALTGYLEKP